MTLGRLAWAPPAGSQWGPEEGAGKGGLVHTSRSNVLGWGVVVCVHARLFLFLFYYYFFGPGRLFIVQRVMSGCISFVFITF